jgi:hypothetical protein
MQANYNKSDIRNIAYENINDKYAWGKYGEFKVLIMLKNGYINANRLCERASTSGGKPKRFENWNANKTSKELIAQISSITGILVVDLTILIKGGSDPELTGTYVHPDLIPHLTSWCSSEFAIKVSKIVNQFFIDKATEEKNKLIKEKDNKIGGLEELLEKIRLENENMHRETKQIIMEQRLETCEANIKLDDISEKLDEATDDRVVLSYDKKKHENVILMRNGINSNTFHLICRQSTSLENAANKYKKENIQAIEVIRFQSPNAVNLRIRIKENLKKYITMRNNTVELLDTNLMSAEEFITKIQEINMQKKDI